MKEFKFENSTSTNAVAQFTSGGHDLGDITVQMNKMLTEGIVHVDSNLKLKNYQIKYVVVHSREIAMVGEVILINHETNTLAVRNCEFIYFDSKDMKEAAIAQKAGRYIVVS
jgi:hypothetical protein